MGISTVQAYHGAQTFEAVGLAADFIDRYFTSTPHQLGGKTSAGIAADAAARHADAYRDDHPKPAHRPLPVGGEDQGRALRGRRARHARHPAPPTGPRGPPASGRRGPPPVPGGPERGTGGAARAPDTCSARRRSSSSSTPRRRSASTSSPSTRQPSTSSRGS